MYFGTSVFPERLADIKLLNTTADMNTIQESRNLLIIGVTSEFTGISSDTNTNRNDKLKNDSIDKDIRSPVKCGEMNESNDKNVNASEGSIIWKKWNPGFLFKTN